jgi:lysozyme family protein
MVNKKMKKLEEYNDNFTSNVDAQSINSNRQEAKKKKLQDLLNKAKNLTSPH